MEKANCPGHRTESDDNNDEVLWECESCGYCQKGEFWRCSKCGEEEFISTVEFSQGDGD